MTWLHGSPIVSRQARPRGRFHTFHRSRSVLLRGLVCIFHLGHRGTNVRLRFSRSGDGLSERSKSWLAYLWEPHNEHRAVADRLLIAIDVEMFGGNNLPFLFMRTVLLLIMLLSLAWEIQSSNLSSSVKLTVGSLSIFALLPANLVVMYSMPLMGGFVQTSTFAVFSLLLWDKTSTLKRALSLVAAFMAGLGVAGGLFIWPVLAFSAWRCGSRPTQLVIVVCAGILMWAVYLHGLPTHAGLLSFDLRRAVELADSPFDF